MSGSQITPAVGLTLLAGACLASAAAVAVLDRAPDPDLRDAMAAVLWPLLALAGTCAPLYAQAYRWMTLSRVLVP